MSRAYMRDLPGELRAPCDWCYPCYTCRDLMQDAADKIKRLQCAIEEIRAIAAENYDPEADPANESTVDMTQHVNGLIVKLCDEAL